MSAPQFTNPVSLVSSMRSSPSTNTWQLTERSPGFSAGACVLAPNLSGLELCDPTKVSFATYGELRTDGLGILDHSVVPHLDSPGHPETGLLGEVAPAYERAGCAYWALRDGQALVIDGSTTQIV